MRKNFKISVFDFSILIKILLEQKEGRSATYLKIKKLYLLIIVFINFIYYKTLYFVSILLHINNFYIDSLHIDGKNVNCVKFQLSLRIKFN